MPDANAHSRVLRVKISHDIYAGLLDGAASSGVSVGDIIYLIAEKWRVRDAIKPFYHPENNLKVRQIRLTPIQYDDVMAWAGQFEVSPAIFLHTVIAKNNIGIQK